MLTLIATGKIKIPEGDAPEDLVKSIRDHGILMPPIIGPDGSIIAGRHRCRAAKALGMAHIMCQVVSAEDAEDIRSACAAGMTIPWEKIKVDLGLVSQHEQSSEVLRLQDVSSQPPSLPADDPASAPQVPVHVKAKTPPG